MTFNAAALTSRMVSRLTLQHGNDVTLNGAPIKAFAKQVGNGEAGIAALTAEGLHGYAAVLDPRNFITTPDYFAPLGSLAPPKNRDIVMWNGRSYTVSYATTHSTDTSYIYGYRTLLPADPNITNSALLPAEWVHLWTPTAQSSRILTDLSVADPGFTDAGKIVAFMTPMSDEDKYAVYGDLDLRADRVFSLVALSKGQILVRADGTAWTVDNASEMYPITGDLRTNAKHLIAIPAVVTF